MRTASWWQIARDYRLGIGLVLAFLLPTLAIAYLGIESVRNQALARRHLLEETHRSIASILVDRIDSRIAEVDRDLIDELLASDPDLETLSLRLHARTVSGDRLVFLVSADRSLLYPPAPKARQGASEIAISAGESGEIEHLLAAAEDAEMRLGQPNLATRLYADAARQSASDAMRIYALNGQARCELKADRPVDALRTYGQLIQEASPLDPVQARRAVIARYQTVICHDALGDEERASTAVVDFLEALVGARLVIGGDTYAFYRSRLADGLFQRDFAPPQRARIAELVEQEELHLQTTTVAQSLALEAARAAPLQTEQDEGEAGLWYVPSTEATGKALALTVTRVASEDGTMTPVTLALVWEEGRLLQLVENMLEEQGPWNQAAVALADSQGEERLANATALLGGSARVSASLTTIPGWSLRAYPPGGSFEEAINQEVRRYVLFLVLVGGTVLAGLVLTARALSKEVALSRLRSEFVSSVSHELRTPLSVIRMFSENLQSGWVAEEQKAEYYETIGRETERLTHLVNNVLSLSRIESGGEQYDLKEGDLNELLREIVDRYAAHLDAVDVQLAKEFPETPVLVFFDAEAIEQVMVNLLSNAAKYIGGEPRSVEVVLRETRRHAEILVADTGIGMSSEEVAHIFDRYYRAENEHVRAVPGSGIGLTLSRHIIGAHGGEIRVRSRPGEGSTVTVLLPLAASRVET